MVDELEPPRKSVELEDAGAHPPDIPDMNGSSDESEQFTDASEGQPGALPNPGDASPVPKTRVERVDDQPAHGEVPGTAAYKLRAKDAVPDEVEVIPDGQRSRASSRVRPEDRPSTPGGTPIPRIVAEKIDPDKPAYGDVPGTSAYEMRKADAKPDEVVRSPISDAPPCKPWDGSPTKASRSEASHEASVDESLESDEGGGGGGGGGEDEGEDEDEDEDEDEGFGDDFDDFEEGQEAGDFGDFGKDEDIPPASTPRHPLATPHYPSIPLLNFSSLASTSSIKSASTPYLKSLFPTAAAAPESAAEPASAGESKIFSSDRSLSLYTQLVAPPPLQPPNWLRSRIRRLFLVSLGVPVDLDEILPASKQKKLVLPSINIARSGSDAVGPEHGAVNRLKDGRNDSSASLDSKGEPKRSGSGRRRKESPGPPELDLLEAVRVGGTTVERLRGMSDGELMGHVKKVEELVKGAEEAEAYWIRKRVEAEREKEAFEGVVGRLVEYARKVRA